jgi:two-component system, OmpR family, response regulator QseB
VTHAKRLLIVEDDADLAENLAEILESLGYEPLVALSAEQALELLREQSVDGVITDFRLPGLDGVELISELRQKGLPVPILMISALIEPADAEQAEMAGALDVLDKPIDLDRLTRLLETFSRPRGEVLIVEDNLALAENLAEALESSGIQTAIGSSAESALSRKTLPRVALVDLRLPDQDGLEVAKRLCARDPTIKIIFVTAYGEEMRERLNTAMSTFGVDGRVPLVAKPFDLEALVRQVRDAVTSNE